ncbi:MAG: helix-turn-helix transcriptional regulator [Oscillospiraceae bacterium]|nr:helix-turn-helix transcriptional regulator [Oscillospiraceae bacterium]
MNKIRTYRERKGLTMTELAEKVGCTPSALSNYELGKREPKQELLIRIAEALDTNVDALLGREQVRDPYEEEDELFGYLEELRTRPEMRMLFDTSRNMSIEQVKAIVAMIERFKDG